MSAEAMMTGTPLVTMAPAYFGGAAPLYEARQLVADFGFGDTPRSAHQRMQDLLTDRPLAEAWSTYVRHNAIRLFGLDHIMAKWGEFLGLPRPLAEEPVEFWA